MHTCDIQITQRELGLTRDRFTQSVLRQILEQNILASGWVNRGSYPSPTNIQALVDDYAERIARGAVQNMQLYFNNLPASGYTLGGKRATSQALLYTKRGLLPGAEDIGAIGEGVAGHYLEYKEQLQFELRPFGVSPDFIFIHLQQHKRVLVEVKTSLHEERMALSTPLGLMEILAKTKFLRRGNYLAYVVYVTILSPSDFRLRILRMEEV